MNLIGKQHENERGRTSDGGIPLLIVWLPPLLTTIGFVIYLSFRSSSKYYWAFNLWDYLYSPYSQLLMALTVVFSLPPVLRFAARHVEKAGRQSLNYGVKGMGGFLRWGLVVVCIFLVLWTFSEERISGDSWVIANDVMQGNPFAIKEPGGSFLFFIALHLSRVFNVAHFDVLRVIVCICGVTFFIFLYKLVCLIFDLKWERVLCTAFLAVPGYARLFFGHVEVYGFLLLSICAYFYFAFLYLKGRTGIFLPAFLLGISFWMHLSAAFLVPTLFYLIFQRRSSGDANENPLGLLARSGFFFMIPVVVFFLSMTLAGYSQSVVQELLVLRNFLPTNKDPSIVPVMIPFFKSRIFIFNDNPVVQYHFFSRNHLLFLVNANFILSPAGFLTAAVLILAHIKKKGFSDPVLRFILIASFFMLAYSLIVYPFYWAYDWDLFSTTAFCYTLLAAYLLFRSTDNRKIIRYLSAYLVFFSLFFNTLPFVLLNSMNRVKDVGPFSASINAIELLKTTLGNPDTIQFFLSSPLSQ